MLLVVVLTVNYFSLFKFLKWRLNKIETIFYSPSYADVYVWYTEVNVQTNCMLLLCEILETCSIIWLLVFKAEHKFPA